MPALGPASECQCGPVGRRLLGHDGLKTRGVLVVAGKFTEMLERTIEGRFDHHDSSP